MDFPHASSTRAEECGDAPLSNARQTHAYRFAWSTSSNGRASLNAAQIGTAFYQVGRKRVTHIMRRERLVEPRGKQTLLEHFAKRIGRHLVATRAHEEIRALFAGKQRRARVEKQSRMEGWLFHATARCALFRAFTEHAHLPSIEIDALKQQTRCFRNTRAACVQELENRAVAHVGGLIAAAPHRKQTHHVGGRNSSRKAASELRERSRHRRDSTRPSLQPQATEK